MACGVLTVVSLVAMASVEMVWTPVKPPTPVTNELSWHAKCVVLLVVQSMVFEVFILVSSYMAAGIASHDLKPVEFPLREERARQWMDIAEHNLCDSSIVLVEYFLKCVTARHFMSPESLIAYTTPLRAGDGRIVFPVRQMQWCVAVPLLMLLSNRSFLAGQCSDVQALLRSAPGLALASVYCIASLATEMTTSVAARNFLMALVAVSFLMVSIDQVVVALQVPSTSSRGPKLSMLVFQFVAFSAYAIVYFAAYFGHLSCELEQNIYSYMDASVKVLHVCFLAMLRNFEVLRDIQVWWMESVAARKDFERLVEQARVPIFGLDLEGRVTSWNASLARITTLPAEAVEGTPVWQLMQEDCREAFQQAISRAAAAPPTAPTNCNAMEILFRKNPWADDSRKTDVAYELSATSDKARLRRAVVVVSVVKKLSRDGAVEGYVGIGQDISEICELKAVEHKKTQLMAVISHELRSPLHGMIGLTSMMENNAKEDSFKRQLRMVHSCANRLLDLVTNVMDMTDAEQRQGKDRGREKRGLVNFLEVAQEVSVMTGMAIDKAGKPLVRPEVKLVNRLPELERFPVVLGNPYKCTQLLYNLVTNACKFTKRGTVTLRAKHNKEASMLELSVEDTGAGISSDALERIFMPFEQDHGSTADARCFQGMGLGLAVCKEVARLHSGSISVESELGKGSTFTVSLPCEDTCVERPLLKASSVMPVERYASKAATRRTGALAMPARLVHGQAASTSSLQECADDNVRCKSIDALAARQAISPDCSARAHTIGDLPALTAPTVASKGCAERMTKKPLVLSVDDDEVNQEIVQHALAGFCDVHSVMDGKSALDYLSGCKGTIQRMPDVILLDIQMPGLTGYDVLAKVRRDTCREHTALPVIMASAKTPVESVAVKSYRLGCSDFLPKPFHTDVLKAKVRVAVQMKQEIADSAVNSAMRRDAALRAKHEQPESSAASVCGEAVRSTPGSHWEQAAKATQEALDETQGRLDAAEQRADKAWERAAQLEARARSSEDRASKAEREAAQLREELQKVRLAAAAAASPVHVHPAAGAKTASPVAPQHAQATVVNPLPQMLHQQAQVLSHHHLEHWMTDAVMDGIPLKWPLSRYPYEPQSALPQYPLPQQSICERLAECEHEVVRLRARLSAEVSAREVVTQQLDGAIQVIAQSRSILGMAEPIS